ncbi:UNVERIFIED_CONTAM: hypothetical protein Sradi_7122000 [Sesamum radiatum]|uniref:Reverse transcriptase domain-containing protein n=1 Tax=Sesamum radiatum TaxID=300843 RepID=A0AAW2IZ47_SESRA
MKSGWTNGRTQCIQVHSLVHRIIHLLYFMVLQGAQTGIYFRFDNFLAKQEGFLDSVQRIWRNNVHGTSMFAMVTKLKALKHIFRQERKKRGDLMENVRLAKSFLDSAQRLLDTYKADYLLHLVKCCRQVYTKAVTIEASMLHQRAKLQWMKHGDQNSKLFYMKIKARRAKQRIYHIKTPNGESLTDISAVTGEFVDAFHTLLGGERRNRTVNIAFLQYNVRHTLTPTEADMLSAPVTGAEIKEALFDIAEDSAPGPDGYTSAFFKAAWSVIGTEFVEAVSEFFRTGRLLKQINTTILALIPKVQLPTFVSDFRPIACCNVTYKTITKIMVSRMQKILHLLIDPCQNAFVPGRNIADNILLAQELLAGYNQVKLPARCTIKLDLQKAYDSIEWDFLFEVMKLFHFPSRFILWVEQCVTTACFSLSINGSIYGFFPSSRGLRQGDPISPYLFVLVMEIWHTLLRYRVQHAPYFQYHWKCKDLGILNLCFADDVLLFCKANLQSIQVFKDTLAEFADLSGLKINPIKSQVILSRAATQEKQRILDLLGFQEGSLPVKYLGVPLIASRLSIADCRPLMEKIDGRVAGWSQLQLSFAGRTQLIKSVLSMLHTYWASVFVLPKGVIRAIETKLRSFLWQGSTGKGYAKVAWDQLCKPKTEGGLGIRNLLVFNQALMLKHLWRIIKRDSTSIWVLWINHYRLQNSTIWTYSGSNGSWSWKKIMKLTPLLKRGLIYKVGDGHTFKLWQDIWHEQGPLCVSYPRGPSITGLPIDSMLNCVIQQGEWNWPSQFDFDINAIIAQLPQITKLKHTILWKNSRGSFNVKSAVSLIQPPAAYSLGIFCYRVNSRLLGMRSCYGSLFWKNYQLWIGLGYHPRLTGCVLCGGQGMETHNHLFFNCPFSKRCLAILHSKIRFQWPHSNWQQGITWATRRWRGKHLHNASSRAVLAAAIYHIWRERNNRMFNAISSSTEAVTRLVIDDVRFKILSVDFTANVQTRALYRIWHIAWPLDA